MSDEQVAPDWEHYIEARETHARAALEAAMPTGLPLAVRNLMPTRPCQVTQPEVIRVSECRETPFGPVLYVGGEK